jgi:hypothetical protein
VVDQPQDAPLRRGPLQLALPGHQALVHHLHRVQAWALILKRAGAEAAEVHHADVAAANALHQLEVRWAQRRRMGEGGRRERADGREVEARVGCSGSRAEDTVSRSESLPPPALATPASPPRPATVRDAGSPSSPRPRSPQALSFR